MPKIRLSDHPHLGGDFVRAIDIARTLDVHLATVLRLIRKGRLSAHKVCGKYLIPRADFVAFMESTRTIPKPPTAPVRSVAARNRAHAKAERELDAMGV